jgi:hypothetical protein
MRLIQLVLVATFLCCANEKPNLIDTHNGNISESIVLVNLRSEDRMTISEALVSIRECESKLIAINTIFSPNNFNKADTSLANAIKSLGNVILISGIAGDSLITSDNYFVKGSIGEGVMGFSYNEEGIFHKLTLPVNGQLKWSFGLTVASYFKPGLASVLLSKYLPDTYYDVVLDRGINDYPSIDIKDLKSQECVNLKNKIILMGDLEPTTDDFIRHVDGSKIYTTIVLANIIENLLNDKLKKSKIE